jgi:hypothetical protein
MPKGADLLVAALENEGVKTLNSRSNPFMGKFEPVCSPWRPATSASEPLSLRAWESSAILSRPRSAAAGRPAPRSAIATAPPLGPRQYFVLLHDSPSETSQTDPGTRG